MAPIYYFLRFLVKVALKIYFKKIAIEGLENIPKRGPILVTPNHQNAFLDAFLVGSFLPMPLFYLTRSDVFTWWSSPLLKMVHMMPIYRIRDGYSNLTKNDAVFEASRKLFLQRRSMLMFAEGGHGEPCYLRPITKGAARLALSAQAELDIDLQVVPVGLNYFNPREPNSKVIIVFGQPVQVKDYLSPYEANNAHGLIKMKEVIAQGMKSTLVIPDKTEDYEARKKSIFQRKNAGLSFSELRKLQTTEELPPEKPKPKHILAKILNPIPFFVVWKILRGTDDIVFHSSLKFIIGLVMLPLWWIASFFVFWLSVGIISATIIVSTMILSVIISYKW